MRDSKKLLRNENIHCAKRSGIHTLAVGCGWVMSGWVREQTSTYRARTSMADAMKFWSGLQNIYIYTYNHFERRTCMLLASYIPTPFSVFIFLIVHTLVTFVLYGRMYDASHTLTDPNQLIIIKKGCQHSQWHVHFIYGRFSSSLAFILSSCLLIFILTFPAFGYFSRYLGHFCPCLLNPLCCCRFFYIVLLPCRCGSLCGE